VNTESTAIAEYSPTAAALGDLAKRMAKVVYDVSTPAGMAAAKRDRAEVRDLRIALEKKRVEIKEPALTRCREIDTEAKRITNELLKFETPPDNAIKAEEKRLADILAAKAAEEERRKADLRERVNELYGNTMLTPTSGAALIAEHIADLEAIKVDESFGEMFGDADDTKKAGLARLRAIYDAAVKHETESDRVRREAIEVERQRQAQAAQEAEARRVSDEKAAAENERLRQERARFEAEQAAAREAQRKENDRIAAEQAAAQKKIDDARRELEARHRAEDAARAERERIARDAAAKAAREADEQKRKNFRPSLDEIAGIIADHYDRDIKTARGWVLGAIESERAA
jgi:colicin import membrane protein